MDATSQTRVLGGWSGVLMSCNGGKRDTVISEKRHREERPLFLKRDSVISEERPLFLKRNTVISAERHRYF
jgi:hypothetical protein